MTGLEIEERLSIGMDQEMRNSHCPAPGVFVVAACLFCKVLRLLSDGVFLLVMLTVTRAAAFLILGSFVCVCVSKNQFSQPVSLRRRH